MNGEKSGICGTEEWWDELETLFDTDPLKILRETIPALIVEINGLNRVVRLPEGSIAAMREVLQDE